MGSATGPMGPSDAFQSGQRLTSRPARTLLAIGSGSPLIAHALADAPFALRPYLGSPLHALSRADSAARMPVRARGPAPRRRAVGHTGRTAAGWCLGRMAGGGRDRQAPATGAAVGRAALGARPAGSLRMDCSLRRCSRAAGSGWAFLEACRSTLAVGVGKPWSRARRSRRDADLVRRAAGAGPLVSRTLPAPQRGVTPRAGASAILATRWWERR